MGASQIVTFKNSPGQFNLLDFNKFINEKKYTINMNSIFCSKYNRVKFDPAEYLVWWYFAYLKPDYLSRQTIKSTHLIPETLGFSI